MNSINASSYSYNDFNFSMQTSSGDTINLKMYDEKSTDFSHQEDANSSQTTLSLSHSYGYSFKYEGNGIDENDQKEIDQAMKLIQPMLDEYFKNVNETAPKMPILSTKRLISTPTYQSLRRAIPKAILMINYSKPSIKH